MSLVDLETQAINSVDVGELETAQHLLDSKKYWDYKAEYKAGLDKYVMPAGVDLDSATSISTKALDTAQNDLLKLNRLKSYVIYGLIAFILLSLIFLIIVLNRVLLSPIARIREAANSVSSGNLDLRLKIESDDEVGELAHDFNNMASSLKKSVTNIEKIVSTRMAELEKTNALLVGRDVTKEREIDRAKTEFISLASHQLRTPLASINWYAEMLADGGAGKLNKTQKQYLDEIYAGNQRMVGLVNTLLNVSRLELGTFIVEPKLTNIIELADGVILEMKPQAEGKEVSVITKFNKDLAELLIDPNLIRIVLQNLISNAVKYTREKGKVWVAIDKDKEDVVITVKDNGLGIPEAQKDKIFTKLFRADNVKKTAIEGTGLGLYIVKSIIEHAGGTVSFTSQENKGTTFTVTFPLKGMEKKEGTRELDS